MVFLAFFYLHRLKRNLHLKPQELQGLQQKAFTALIKKAYNTVPFYYRKFKSTGIKPEDIKTLDDIHRIPLTTKREIQANRIEDLIAFNVNPNTLIKRTTSGSTGMPLTTFVNRKIHDFENAVRYRAFFENGLKLRDKVAVISDPRFFSEEKRFIQNFKLMNSKPISIYDPPEKQIASLFEYQPTVIKGYTSTLYLLAERLRENYKIEIKPRLIFTGAELLDIFSRKKISSAFDAELFDYYSCSEFGLLAWECREHDGYHINADSVLMEFLDDDGEAVAPGERGRVVCTGLFNNVMPLIRYELGDVAIPVDSECSCGVTLPLIKVIGGRTDDFLVATDGRLISPTVFFPYPFENVDWIKQFRIIQESMRRIVIQLVIRETIEDIGQELKNAERKIHELFGDDMEVRFEFVERIPLDHSGKLRKVISHVKSQHKNS